MQEKLAKAKLQFAEKNEVFVEQATSLRAQAEQQSNAAKQLLLANIAKVAEVGEQAQHVVVGAAKEAVAAAAEEATKTVYKGHGAMAAAAALRAEMEEKAEEDLHPFGAGVANLLTQASQVGDSQAQIAKALWVLYLPI